MQVKSVQVQNRLTYFLSLIAIITFASCSPLKKLDQSAHGLLINNSDMENAHTGIAIYDPVAKKFLYDYQGDKYFVPASNTKIVSLFAGLKYLGDSLVGLRYEETPDSVFILPTGDPSFLHPDFTNHPVYNFLKSTKKPIGINESNWLEQGLGSGWMWNDYNDDYMVERSALPIYGNVIKWIQVRDSASLSAMANEEAFVYSEPDVNWKVKLLADTANKTFAVQRDFASNQFTVKQSKEPNATVTVPFITNGLQSALELLHDTLQKDVYVSTSVHNYSEEVRSQPSDTLYRNMMYRSDNFFAEQVLLMACQEKFKVMNDEKIINYLLQGDLKELPQSPHWVDGSGLSRYNLFSPRDFVWILDHLEVQYGMSRLKKIFPTGGIGTLLALKQDSGVIYAKTGSMSGVFCLSGYLYTKKDRRLVFSVLVNNHSGTARSIRGKIIDYLLWIREKY